MMNEPIQKPVASAIHAKHPPSSLRNKEICPCLVASQETNIAAEKGTLMHRAAEIRDLSGLTDQFSRINAPKPKARPCRVGE